METALAQSLVDSVESEFSLHVKLLRRLRHEADEGEARRHPSARFWGRLLPESVADIWQEMKVAERERRQILRRIAEGSGAWRLSNVVAEMPYEQSERLLELRRYFAVVTTEIVTELRTREAA